MWLERAVGKDLAPPCVTPQWFFFFFFLSHFILFFLAGRRLLLLVVLTSSNSLCKSEWYVPFQSVTEEKYELKLCINEASIIVSSVEKDPKISCTITITSPVIREPPPVKPEPGNNWSYGSNVGPVSWWHSFTLWIFICIFFLWFQNIIESNKN